MNLEEQVVSLETAKKLKDGGWKKETYCIWWDYINNIDKGNPHFTIVTQENGFSYKHPNTFWYPAPTVSELLEELLAFIEKSIFCLEFQKWTSYMEENEKGETIAFDGITLQESLATMWLYLKQNNLLKEGV